MEAQPAAKQRLYGFIAIVAASAFTFFFGLGRIGFLGPDEPRYAEVAREMFASGDYISTRLCGCLWFEKPALLYWMSAAGYHFFGVNELAARIPSAVAAIGTVALLYFTLRAINRPRLALAAAFVLSTSGIFIAYARVAVPDMVLTTSVTGALLAATLWTMSAGRSRIVYLVVCFASVGLATLAKGLVGIVLVLAIFGVYLFFVGRLREIRWRDCLIGTAVFIVVAGIWYVPVTMRHGWSFIDEFFIRHHFQRYTSNEFGHPQPFYFFFLVAISGAAPWTFFLVPAIARLRSLQAKAGSRDSLLLLAWIWIVVPLVFFSFSGSKLPGYILPIFPALAIVLGAEVERIWNREAGRLLTIAVWMTAVMLIGIGVAFLVDSHRESIDTSVLRTSLLALPLAIAAVSTMLLAARRVRAVIAGAGALVVSLVLAAVILLLPVLRDEVTLKTLSLEAAAALRPGEKIAFYLKKEFAPVFYAEGRVLCEPKRGTTFYALHQEMLAGALEFEPSLIVITNTNWLPGLQADPRFSIEFIAEQGDSLALRVAMKK